MFLEIFFSFTPTELVVSFGKSSRYNFASLSGFIGVYAKLHYTGALCKDGTIFQSSHDTGEPATFGLNQVIKGWTQGVPGMKVGGVRRLIIPSELGYGSARAASNIPPNSDLVFDIELIDIPKKWYE